MGPIPKVADRGPIPEGYIYAANMGLKSCMYFLGMGSMPKSGIYAPGIGFVPGGWV